jgi:glyoxylase-like metal-dependent hydrolase (beta-lactamase superfamily II)/rhodanese-related sulfurtransferase
VTGEIVQIVTVPLPQLGNRCHLLHDGSHGIVVDPPRDHTVVEDAAAEAGVDIRAVADTHVHNDYVSGAPLLARRHDADYFVSAAERVAVPHVGVRGGDVLEVGGLTLEVLHAPGHTEHHQAFLVGDGAGPAALLSGGSLLHGTVGRTDLVSRDRTTDLARAQWSTARRLAELPRRTLLLPTHGFGSFCASGVAGLDDSGTVGDEHPVNPALTLDLDTFVSDLVAGYGPVPSYYRHMADLNRAGAGGSPGRSAVRVTVEDVTDAVLAGHWVIDVRQRPAFARGHVAGSVNIEDGHQFATYVGWLVPWQDDIVLLADDPSRLDAAVTDLAGIGIEGVGIHVLTPETLLPASHRRVGWEALRETDHRPVLLDVRRLDEFDSGGVAGALHVPLHELEHRLGELPAGEIWVYCRTGFRAGIGASILQRAGHPVVHIDDDLVRAAELQLPVRGSVAA